MNNKIKSLCVAAMTLIFTNFAVAETTGEPPDAVMYVKIGLVTFSSCRLLVGLTGGAEKECPKDVIKAAKDGYAEALKSLKGNTEAISFLKQYREAMLNAAATIQPLLDERKMSYRLRQDKVEAELTRLANRLEMEI